MLYFKMKGEKMNENILAVKDLKIKLTSGKSLVKGISFEVLKGRVLGIVGESGSGKTLTCKAIVNLLSKKTFDITGTIKFDNKNILAMTEKEINAIRGKDISIIMQNPMTAFNPVIKIGDQIIETLRAHLTITKQEAYDLGIQELNKMNLERVDEIMNSYSYTLSGGMLQRIMIAISLMLNPLVIIADEATTALDVKTQSIILSEFEKMRDCGIGLIVVSHDFGVIAQIADNVIVMKDGEVIESGTVCDLFDNPRRGYTKKLLSARFLRKEVELC